MQPWIGLVGDVVRCSGIQTGLFSEQLHSVLFLSVWLNCSFRVSMSTCSVCQGSSDECPAPVPWAQLTLLCERPVKLQRGLRWAPFGSRLVIKQSSNCGMTRLIQPWSLTRTEFFLWGFAAVNSICNVSVCILRLLGVASCSHRNTDFICVCNMIFFLKREGGNEILCLCGWWFVLLSKAEHSQCSLDGSLQGAWWCRKCSKRQEFQKLTPVWVSLAGCKELCVPFRGWGCR